MNNPIRVLIIEDSEDDKELMLRELRQGGYNPEYILVETREALNSALDKQSWDIVLSDHVMPNFDGLSALNIVKERELDIPFIIISGTIGEDVAVMAMKAGAQDYIMKSSLKRLVPTVRRELKEFENRCKRNQAEKLLRENELKFRTLADFTYDMEYWEDENKQIIYISPSCERLTGYTQDEFIANPKLLESIIYPDDVSSVIKHYEIIYSYKNKEDFGELEFRIIRKDKSVIYIYHICRSIYNEDKKYLGRRVSNRDITDRHHAQESLKQSELKYKQLFNDDLSGNFIISIDGTIELCNPAMAKIFGFNSVDELMKWNFTRFYSNKDDREKFLDLIREKKKVERYEQEHITRDGKVIILIKNVIGEFDKNGELIRLKGYMFDDTERKLTEKELIKAKEKAEESNKLKDAFIANMSHEIRTPLGGILGISSIIKGLYAEHISEKDEELFAGIEHSSKRIIRTVDMILNYSRIQTGEFPISPKQIDLSSICENLIKEFRSASNSKLLKLSFENRCSKTIEIFGDEYSVTNAISNLIDNAIKYTEKGFVKIIIYEGKNDEVLLDIEDSGIGISEEYLKHIFYPYQQEQMGYGRAYEGVGLGLSIVKRFLNLNKADLFVKSEKGKGSTFTINFGNAFKASEEKIDVKKTSVISDKQETTNKPSVLIVEDDSVNQMTIKIFLRNLYNTFITDSAEGALEIIKNNKVDVILMDISIKGNKNGLELTKELKASKEYSKIAVIALTAHAFDSDRKNALQAGCDDYISKPFLKEVLLKTISKFV